MQAGRTTITVLTVAAIGAAAFGGGVLFSRSLGGGYEAAPIPAGSARVEAPKPPVQPKSIDIDGAVSAEQLEALTALGYLSGYVEATEAKGITVHDADRAHAGLNVYSSGHAPEAYLMDMDGAVSHTWRYAYEDMFGRKKPEGNIGDFWRRVHVFENGDAIGIFETLGIFKVEKDSKLLWAQHNAAHHDLFVHDDGSIYTLTQQSNTYDWFADGLPVIDDFITVMSPDGETLRRVSVLECLNNSPYSAILQNEYKGGELLHTNAIKFLDGRHEATSPVFRRGNVMLSIRELGLVAIVDLEQEAIVWALAGQWYRQHEPTLLDNGNLLLFDNLGNAGMAKVLEVHPFTQEVAWTYGEAEGEAVKSPVCGSVLRFPNGNTLINEACQGRALEVTPDNEVVWEFFSPHRPPKEHRLRAAFLEFTRLPADFEATWLH